MVRDLKPARLLLVDRKRLLKLLGARAYRDRPHLVLEIDTAELLRRYADKATLSSINSGATFAMSPAPRGPETFRHIADHPDDKPIVELAVDYAVPDIEAFTISVSRWHGAEKLEEVWRRSYRAPRSHSGEYGTGR